MFDNSVFIVFLGKDFDQPPVGFTRRQMLLALGQYVARQGGLVLCLDRPVCPAVTTATQPEKMAAWLRGKRGLRQLMPGMYLYTPWFLLHEQLAPAVPGVIAANRRALKAQVDRCLKAVGAESRKKISLVFHPFQKDMVGICREDLLVYEWYDEHAPVGDRTSLLNPAAGARKRIELYQENLVQTADVLIATCQDLYDRGKLVNPNTYLLQNGVDYERFVNADPSPPPDVEVRHPIIGFAGTAKQIVDYELVTACARLHPEWNFVFLGPEDTSRRFQSWRPFVEIKKQPNIRFWGLKPELEVPRYMKQFDVCLVPYVTNSDCTAAIYPLKINEYLALGKPVISTDYVKDFAEYRDVIYLSKDDPQSFSEAIHAALTRPDPGRIERGRRIAWENSWDNRAKKFCDIVFSHLRVPSIVSAT